ncbi:putative endonuclease [Halomicronema hongdechloris C2206]|uniref:Endonuclease n=1 Tax=Halomicronema hongdechloris C2206 TaxID=1641165 RepID=A0A1Z3HNW0_9CYAN|nr:thermonuclease family protein [Halomicronema hongdechloris]ASC71847.1 putative endonuclease [Halomicronema hongdechloris C2206]
MRVLRGFIPALLLLGIAIVVRWIPDSLTQVMAGDTAEPPEAAGQVYELVPGSVYDGDTLRVTNGRGDLKIRLCGIDAPEIEQALGIAARDHLRSLLAQGNGSLLLVPVEQDRYGRTVAEIFVPLAGQAEEIHLNTQMVLDGYAYHYAQYSDACPNGRLLARAEEQAQAQQRGIWGDENAVPPWDYRQRHRTAVDEVLWSAR